jgi:tripartite-type tricarboxylate transporter receptor subunit TctC
MASDLRRTVAGLFALGMTLTHPLGANAQSAAQFYQGRTVTLIVSTGVGGGYDQYGRLLIKYLPRYLPGSPATTIQRDGSTISDGAISGISA